MPSAVLPFFSINMLFYYSTILSKGTGGGMVSARPLRRILEDYLEVDSSKDSKVHRLLTSDILNKYFFRIPFARRDLIFDADEPANEVYFIEIGDVEIVTMSTDSIVRRINKISSGGCFGESDFFLSRKHCVRAFCWTDSICWIFNNKDSYNKMELEEPQLCMLLQHMFLKSLSQRLVLRILCIQHLLTISLIFSEVK